MTIPSITLTVPFSVLIVSFVGWAITMKVYDLKRTKGSFIDLSGIGFIFFTLVWIILFLFGELLSFYFAK